jgi:hypothetical protein
MSRSTRRVSAVLAIAFAASAAISLTLAPVSFASAADGGGPPMPPGAIRHIVVIDLENEDASATFGPNSPATYLNGTLLRWVS